MGSQYVDAQDAVMQIQASHQQQVVELRAAHDILEYNLDNTSVIHAKVQVAPLEFNYFQYYLVIFLTGSEFEFNC
ncbi:uncharacterized protein A4U43_C08F21460, partial [Asparagus officinalis]